MHRQFTRGICDGIDFDGEARTRGDIPISNKVHIQKAVRAIAGSQEIDFSKASAPSLEPEHQVFSLLFASLKMQQDIDIAGWPGGGVLRAANQVEGLHPKLPRIQFRRDPLRHAKSPAPVFIRSSLDDVSIRFR